MNVILSNVKDLVISCFKYSLCFREYFFYEMAIPELVGDDIALADLFIAFLFSIRFEHVD